MHSPGLIRALALALPVLALLLAWRCRPPGRRLAGAALLATVWQLPALLLVHALNQHAGWWHYQAGGGLLHGMPADLWLGWAILWGALPVIALPGQHPALTVILLAALDAALMPLCAPVVQLQPHWWAGEGVAIALSLVPGLLLARLTAAERHLPVRATLQFFAFSGLMLWVIPSIVQEQTGGSWQTALARPSRVQAAFLALAVFVSTPALSAVQEFCQRGQGTAFPLDPPRRLVTSGPYAWIANPMQTGMTLLFLLWGVWTGSIWVGLVSLVAMSTGAGIAGWNEAGEMKQRYGNTWERYRATVPAWRLRLRPRVPVPARLYVASTCTPCRSLGEWLRHRGPVGLEILPAETHPDRALTRLTYEAPGWTESGTRALCRALEHLHPGWAWAGWMLRLPGLATVVQLLTDAAGGGPRELPRTDGAPPSP